MTVLNCSLIPTYRLFLIPSLLVAFTACEAPSDSSGAKTNGSAVLDEVDTTGNAAGDTSGGGTTDTAGVDTMWPSVDTGPDEWDTQTPEPDSTTPDVSEPADIVETPDLVPFPDIVVTDDVSDVGEDSGETATDVPIHTDIADTSDPDVPTPPEDAGGAEDTGNNNPQGVDPPPGTGCDMPPLTPLAFTQLAGFAGSEDFAFDFDGNLVYTNNGNLIKKKKTGEKEVIVPNIGGTAGTAVLPNGNIVVAAGSKIVIAYKEGGYKTLLSGLAYPNGLDVDHENYIYVAEQNGGRLRRIDSETGEYEIIAEDLYNPNGVAFAPGYKRVYVGSFGGGTVHYVDRNDDGTWSAPVLFAKINGDKTEVGPPPEPVDPPPLEFSPCAGKTAGDGCIDYAGYEGLCSGAAGMLTCTKKEGAHKPQDVACAGKQSGNTCSISIWGQPFYGTCANLGTVAECCKTTNKKGCPADPPCTDCVCEADSYCCQTAWDNICAGEAKGICADSCLCASGGTSTVSLSCVTKLDPIAFCDGLQVGDLCAYIESADKVLGGYCTDMAGTALGAPFPTSGVACVPPEYSKGKPTSGGGGGGGLDGLNVDECGNVYVSEYVVGYLWRIFPNGVIEKAAKLPSSWIPNLDFGRGIGGWDDRTLYVMNLNGGNIYEVAAKFRGKEITMPLPKAP